MENESKARFWKDIDAFAQTDSAISFISKKCKQIPLALACLGTSHDPLSTVLHRNIKKYRYDWTNALSSDLMFP